MSYTAYPSTHAGWIAYLNRGRHKEHTTSRPIGSSRTKRVYRFSNGDVGLKYHHTFCVIFHDDGTVTYDTGGWHTITTKQFLNAHGPTRVWSEKGTLYMPVDNPSYTPAKVQKCRKCHGKAVLPWSCYGPGYCYAGYGGRTCEHGETGTHKRQECEHGQTMGHSLPDINCWNCNGTGKRDYGSKPIHFAWAGNAYRFHPDEVENGAYVGYTQPASVVGTHVVPKFNGDYAQAGTILTGLIPGLDAMVKCPCSCNGIQPGPVRSCIIHLNDAHHPRNGVEDEWSRERIADWLETLDVDLRFPTPA